MGGTSVMSINVVEDSLRREQRRAVHMQYALFISIVALSSVFGLTIALGHLARSTAVVSRHVLGNMSVAADVRRADWAVR